ncbi:D-alanine--D-alanine ligase [Ameyamaea chiangmaiensis]|uniref:D-alanine--D-alanine ligase n=1 Tax=Ameyamaea chiangmaiensis TaxID=442969 RepID=A0A850PCF9_9PROT|nr:D-alanine--D-alanine ligase [Ameyamaea chiangmaiensis]MBS4074372.1 D-alanine--D-alanine ligase [Ameyamaea chiangmaiensis]NVN41814.1 D-alanine--D-alanine ligase [Ameyamaea chiangmaiensis]
METRRVTVLAGGLSAERPVSQASSEGVVGALRDEGFAVSVVDPGADLGALVAAITDSRPDVVFNALHGRFGEDGTIQGILDWMNVPYTHSGLRASSVAMDKSAARAAFAGAGLPVATGRMIDVAELRERDPFEGSYVVKPHNEGSSVGVEIVHPGSNRRAAIAEGWRFGRTALVEEFIPGRELTVGVLDGRALTVTDITPSAGITAGFYDFEAKYGQGGSTHHLPANVHPDTFARAMDLACATHRTLGCRGATRTDFRYDDTRAAGGPGRLVILEINTQPGLTPTSLLPEQAAFTGMSYGTLCRWMVDHAACRT